MTCLRNLASLTPRSRTHAERRPAHRAAERRRLRQRLDHQHRRHQRLVRKVALEELFVDGDVLERDQPLSRLMLGDAVDEQRGKAVGEAFENVRGRGAH